MNERKGARVESVTARAPGRLDVMGGIADYSGGLVLQMPLAVATRATVVAIEDPRIEVVSVAKEEDVGPRRFAVDLGLAAEALSTYEAAHDFFSEKPPDRWAAYVLGCLTALHVEENLPITTGLSIQITSDVPEGKGVSSSAALEVSVMGALVELFGVSVDHPRIAQLCQTVENRVAGAPCGIMDQMTAACGKRDHLLSLLCQPAEMQGHIPLPANVSVWGIDSGVRHSVGGSDYSTVRSAAAIGYRILAELEGLPVQQVSSGRVVIDDDRFGGYLANVGTSNLNRHMDRLPGRMRGAAFLEAFGGISDPTVSIRPDVDYPVRAATVHPVAEHDRNRRFVRLLGSEPTEKVLALMGELMYLSHASYSACGLGSDGTDRLVELVQDAGYHKGLFGARITGGGSGGSVAVLASSTAAEGVRSIAAQYARESGLSVTVFEGSSDGLGIMRN